MLGSLQKTKIIISGSLSTIPIINFSDTIPPQGNSFSTSTIHWIPTVFLATLSMGIIPDNDGGVWLTSYFKLHKFNSQIQTFSNIPIPFEPTAILKDSKGKIWLGRWGA